MPAQVGSRNVYADLGFRNADAMFRKAKITAEIARTLKKAGYPEREAARRLRAPHTKLSKVMRGQFERIAERTLENWLNRLAIGSATRKPKRVGTLAEFFANSPLRRSGLKLNSPRPHSAPFHAADHLRSDAEIAIYIGEMLAGGDARAVLVALRTVAEALGGTGALAEKAGPSREALYRTLSERGGPGLSTLAVILAAAGLRLSVCSPTRKPRSRARAYYGCDLNQTRILPEIGQEPTLDRSFVGAGTSSGSISMVPRHVESSHCEHETGSGVI